MKRFPQKRVFITGAGSGFGRALALEFAAKGWRIGVSDIDESRAKETLGLVEQAGGSGMVILCDVTRLEDLEKAAQTLEQAWGGVDVVVNNAGVAGAGYIEKIPQTQWDWILDLNLKSVIYGCRVFVPMLEKQGGRPHYQHGKQRRNCIPAGNELLQCYKGGCHFPFRNIENRACPKKNRRYCCCAHLFPVKSHGQF